MPDFFKCSSRTNPQPIYKATNFCLVASPRIARQIKQSSIWLHPYRLDRQWQLYILGELVSSNRSPLCDWAGPPICPLQAVKLFPLFFCLTCIVQGESLCCRVLASHSSLSSCVSTIQDALSSLSPAPSSVEVSIVTQTVTVRHPHNLSPSLIKSTIHGEGFDIVSTPASSTWLTDLL